MNSGTDKNMDGSESSDFAEATLGGASLPQRTEDTLVPVTEQEIVEYLIHQPAFFERHADLLATVQLCSPHSGRTVSLQERQAEMLRDKIKSMELRLMEMVRYGNENMLIADKLQRFTVSLLRAGRAVELPEKIVQHMQNDFMVPQAAIRLWKINGLFSDRDFTQGISDEVVNFASSIHEPYCGINSDFEAGKWLENPDLVGSMAMIALRQSSNHDAFGMLVLGSPDPQRYHAGIGTDFLQRIGQLCSAALTRLL